MIGLNLSMLLYASVGTPKISPLGLCWCSRAKISTQAQPTGMKSSNQAVLDRLSAMQPINLHFFRLSRSPVARLHDPNPKNWAWIFSAHVTIWSGFKLTELGPLQLGSYVIYMNWCMVICASLLGRSAFNKRI